MSKRKSLDQKLSDFVYREEFKDNFEITEFSEIDETLFCRYCKKDLMAKTSILKKHLDTICHKERASVLRNETLTQKDFNEDLGKLFIESNIPFWKLQTNVWKEWVEKWTQYRCPSTTWMRKYYTPSLYEQTIEKIREELSDEYIWLSVDETTDTKGKHVVNIIIGPLNDDKPNAQYLIHTEFVKNVNNTTINQSVLTGLNILWPNGIKYEKLLLFITDRASYMKVCGQNLKAFFPKLHHITCVCHGLHNLCEFLMKNFMNITRLITCSNMSFSKSHSRKEHFEQNSMSLPPKTVFTRWGTFIKACIYFPDNFDRIGDIIQHMEIDSSTYFNEFKEFIEAKELIFNDLQLINNNFRQIPQLITELEANDINLLRAFEKLENFRRDLASNTTDIGISVSKRFEEIISDNPGYEELRNISRIITESRGENTEKLSFEEILKFSNAYITNACVERSFSKYKLIFSDLRQSLTKENLKQYLICNFNSGVFTNKSQIP